MIEFTNLTSKPIRREVFEKLYRKTMPNNFELSVVFAPPALMRKINRRYRKSSKSANVLSFLLESERGEIFLNRNEKNLPRLFIHGCLHLLGCDHQRDCDAKRMQRREQEILKTSGRRAPSG